MRRRLLASLAATAAVAASLLISSAGPATAADAAATPAATPSAITQDAGSAPVGRIPAEIKVPDGFKIVATLRGVGSQVYTCTNGAFVLREPVAVLSNPRGTPVAIHGLGPFWAHFDGSKSRPPKGGVSNPLPGRPNIPWLLLDATPTPGAGGTFGNVRYIQRIDTRDGVAPANCSGTTTLSVGYSANYVFWAPK